MDTNKIVEQSRGIALDTVPAGGSEHTDVILQIFTANPDKHFSGKDIKALFLEAGVELANPSNILFQLMKQDKLVRPKSGWYKLA